MTAAVAVLGASATFGVWGASSSGVGDPTSGPRFKAIELTHPALP